MVSCESHRLDWQSEQSSEVRKMISRGRLASYYLLGLAVAYTDRIYRQSSCPENQTCLPFSQCDDVAIDKLVQSIQANAEVQKLI